MAGMKRKMDDTESKHGSFTEENLPAYTFALGGDVFLSCNLFRDKMLIHIRKHKIHDGRYYPTTEGVAFTRHQFSTLTNSSYLKDKSVDDGKNDPWYDFFIDLPAPLNPITVYNETTAGIPDRSTDSEILITFAADSVVLNRDYTCRSGRTYTRSVTLNNEQWSNVFTQSERVLSAVSDLRFQNAQFKELFELVSGNPAPTTAPVSAQEDIDGVVPYTLNFMVKSELYNAIAEYPGLANPLVTDKLNQNTLQNFNAAVLNVKLFDVVRNFYKSVCDYPRLPLVENGMLHFVTSDFLNSINIAELVKTGRELFCVNSV